MFTRKLYFDECGVIAGYAVFLGAPSALQTALALRQAIWRKADPAWPICGIRPKRPERAYMDILRNIQRTCEVLTSIVH